MTAVFPEPETANIPDENATDEEVAHELETGEFEALDSGREP
jgi:hypothetical protein